MLFIVFPSEFTGIFLQPGSARLCMMLSRFFITEASFIASCTLRLLAIDQAESWTSSTLAIADSVVQDTPSRGACFLCCISVPCGVLGHYSFLYVSEVHVIVGT